MRYASELHLPDPRVTSLPERRPHPMHRIKAAVGSLFSVVHLRGREKILCARTSVTRGGGERDLNDDSVILTQYLTNSVLFSN